jgi:hypothetical protein
MATVATVEVPADEFSLGRALAAAGDYYATLAQFVPTENRFVPYLWLENGDPSEVTASLRSQPRITAVTTADDSSGPILYEIEWTGRPDGILSILLEVECDVVEAHGTPEGWVFELLGADHGELATFQSACNDRDVDVRIESVNRSAGTRDDRSGLTRKQREILRLAHSGGYFGVPREVTVTELAGALDISPQAASKRLRRGLETAVGHVLDGV